MTGVKVYRSRYSGEEIDGAIMKALMFDPQENGWIHVSSNEAYPANLGDFTTPGNYIVDYFTDGPTSLEGHSPINVSVFDDNGTLTEFIIVLNNVYYRFFSYDTGMYEAQWRMRKTTNCFYINEEPPEPDTDTIKIVPDENGEYVMYWWNGTEWKAVTYPDVMRQSVYDPQNRSTDFFKYTDDLFQQMTSTSVGMVLEDTEITNKWPGVVSCVRIDSSNNTMIAFKGTSKMILIDRTYEVYPYDLPISFNDPQITGYISSNDMLLHCIVYDMGDGSSIWTYDPSTDAWTEVDLSSLTIDLIKGGTVEQLNITPLALFGHQVGSINVDASSSLIVKYANAAGTISYLRLQIDADGYYSYYPVTVPVYITDKDAYFKTGIFWKTTFYRGNDKMTPVRTNSAIVPEIGIMSACEYPYSFGIDESDTVCAVAEVQWEWRNQNESYNQIPKFVFRAWFSNAEEGDYAVPEIATYLSEVDYYVALSGFREFFGDYTGFGISTTGKLDKIDIVYDWESDQYQIDINTVNQLEDPTMVWEGICYFVSSMCFFGRSVTIPASAHLFVSSEEQNLLDAVSVHLMNGDIHFTEQDRAILGTRETKDNAEIKFNRITTDNREYIDSQINESIEDYNQLLLEYEKLLDEFVEHINDKRLHTDEDEKAYWNSKADGNHEHNLDGRVKINANQIVEGVLDIERIPRGAKERLTKVLSIEERNKLTIDDVQNGDRVAVKDDDANRENAYVVYTVVNQDLLCRVDEATGETILGVDEAFHEDAAGTGVYIDWVNVEHTPTTIAGYGITDSYTRTETEEEIDKRVKAQSIILEDRFLMYDLDDLYRVIHDTNDEVHIIEEELADAIEISEQVQIMDDLLILQEERINQMAEDLSEADALVEDLLTKFE